MFTLTISADDLTALGAKGAAGALQLAMYTPVLDATSGRATTTAPWRVTLDGTGYTESQVADIPAGNGLRVDSLIPGWDGSFFFRQPDPADIVAGKISVVVMMLKYRVAEDTLLPLPAGATALALVTDAKTVAVAAQATANAALPAANLDAASTALLANPASQFATLQKETIDAGVAEGVSAPALATKQSFDTRESQGLRRFRTALAGRNACIWNIGDSITWGYKSLALANRWPSVLRDTLRNRFPTTGVAGGFGWMSPRHASGSVSHTDDAVVTAGGTFPSSNWGLDRNAFVMSAAASITYTFTGTGADILYAPYPGGGVFSYQIDGGTAVNVSANWSVQQYAVKNSDIRGLSAGVHTVKLSWVSGNVYTTGLFVYNGDETSGIRSWVAGWPGVPSSYFYDSTNFNDGFLGYIDTARFMKPDLVVIELGTNDFGLGVTVAAFKANMQGLIARIKSRTATINEVQTLTIGGAPTGGTFAINIIGNTTAPIAYNATPAAVQAAVQALASVGAGNATVTGISGSSYRIEFVGALANQNIIQSIATSSLTGGTSPTSTVTTYVDGTPSYVPSFLLVAMYPINGAAPVAAWQSFVDAMYEIAEADPDGAVAVYDVQDRTTNVAGTTIGGLLDGDLTHPNPTGDRYIGEGLAAFVSPI